jgi:hypothetical protein
VLDVQPVAALHLHRGGALGSHLGHQNPQVSQQFLVGRGPGGGDRGGDPAAGVRLAGHPGGELGRPVPGEHQVRVRVDEAGDDAALTQVGATIGGRSGGRRPEPGDPAVGDHHCPPR